jgi:branched-chain amino acid transport system substrate-binding protein
MTRKWFALMVAAVALALAIAAPPTGWTADPFVIGINTTLSGPGGPYGLHYKMGAELARDEINAAGGINGSPLELVIDDNKLSPTEAVTIAKKTLPKAHATIVGMSGSAFLAVMPVAGELKVPMVASALGTIALTEGKNPWVFRLSGNDRVAGRCAADYMVDQLKKKKVAIIHDSNDYGVGGMSSIKARLKHHGLEPVAVESFNTGELDFSPHALRIKTSGADGVIIWAYQKEAALILKKMHQVGYPGQLMLGSAVDTDAFAELAGADAHDVPYSIYIRFGDPKDQRMQAFIKKFQERFKTPPDLYSMGTYDSEVLLAQAFRKAGPDREKIRDTLRTMKFDGVAGHVEFDERGDSIRNSYIMKWVHDKNTKKSHREHLYTFTVEQLRAN